VRMHKENLSSVVGLIRHIHTLSVCKASVVWTEFSRCRSAGIYAKDSSSFPAVFYHTCSLTSIDAIANRSIGRKQDSFERLS
jgi:hypothetical protein